MSKKKRKEDAEELFLIYHDILKKKFAGKPSYKIYQYIPEDRGCPQLPPPPQACGGGEVGWEKTPLGTSIIITWERMVNYYPQKDP